MMRQPSLPDDFAGVVRLFPLPNLVLFPNVMQPLHVFEPRYRCLTADALASDRLLAQALLQPGWETDYEGKPPLYPVVCVGQIIAEERLDDGRFNIMVHGLSRARLTEELAGDVPYRRARVELLADRPVADPDMESRLRRQLIRRVPRWFPKENGLRKQLVELLESDLTLGALSDLVAFALPLPVDLKQALLAEPDVRRRTRRLLRRLQGDEGLTFPPQFSVN